MKINFWDCSHHEYEEYWDGESEGRAYLCKHPNGTGSCLLENKWCNEKDECRLLSRPTQPQPEGQQDDPDDKPT